MKGALVYSRPTALSMTSAELREQWKARSAAYGWGFPSDWHVPAVDAVCDALTSNADVWAAAERLGRQRADAGVSLAEALVDVDGLPPLRISVTPIRCDVRSPWAGPTGSQLHRRVWKIR